MKERALTVRERDISALMVAARLGADVTSCSSSATYRATGCDPNQPAPGAARMPLFDSRRGSLEVIDEGVEQSRAGTVGAVRRALLRLVRCFRTRTEQTTAGPTGR